jgi:hypothetical protein
MSNIEEILLSLEAKMDLILDKIQESEDTPPIGDWISEKSAMRLTGLSRTSLFRLRNANKLTSSKLKEKRIFYRKSDLERLLNKNEGEQ